MNDGETRETCDAVVADLRRLRAASGNVPYAEIALRIQGKRRSQGRSEGAPGPARTTVYDAFRPGRSRLDARLIGEIVEALGVPKESVPAWVERASTARPSSGVLEFAESIPPPTTSAPGPVDSAAPADPAGPAHPADQADAEGQVHAAPKLTPDQPSVDGGLARKRPLSWGVIFGVMAFSVVINLFGHFIVAALRLPLFFDMIGTAITAIVVGPWAGVLVAFVSNTGGVWLSGPQSLSFALVNIAGALVWGYGARRFRMASTISRYFLLNVLVAVCCSAVAVPIILVMYHGGTGHAAENVVWTLQMLGQTQGLAVLASNLVASITDKLICGFVALAVIAFIAQRWSIPWIERAGVGGPSLVDLSKGPFDSAARPGSGPAADPGPQPPDNTPR